MPWLTVMFLIVLSLCLVARTVLFSIVRLLLWLLEICFAYQWVNTLRDMLIELQNKRSMCQPLLSNYIILEGSSHCTLMVCWTAGQQVEWWILHLGHDSYQNNSLAQVFRSLVHPCTVRNYGLKYHSFIHCYSFHTLLTLLRSGIY